MKEESGFTLIEVIMASSLLVLTSIFICKFFLVSSKVNIGVYEKDKMNIAMTNKMEQVRAAPYDFINKNEDKSKRRYCTFEPYAQFYYCNNEDGTYDNKRFEEYAKNTNIKNPKTSPLSINIKKYEVAFAGMNNRMDYFYLQDDLNGFLEDTNADNAKDINRIISIVNKAKIKEYYDAQWNKTKEENAKYETETNVTRKIENTEVNAYEVDTEMGKTKRYNTVFMSQYLGVLAKNTKNVDKDAKCDVSNDCKEYIFFVFYDYTNEYLKEDLKKAFGEKIPSDNELNVFLLQLINFQNDKKLSEMSLKGITDTYGGSTEKNYYKFFAEHTGAKYKKDGMQFSNASKFNLKDEPDRNSLSVRIDFDRLSNQNKYKVDIYNLTDRPMDLYLIHQKGNISEIPVHITGGDVSKTEAFTTVNLCRTSYRISVKATRREDNYKMMEYDTEKFISGEETSDFNFFKR